MAIPKPETARKAIATVLAASRHDADLTQAELAKMLGWSRGKLAKIESRGRIEAAEMIQLARALKKEAEKRSAEEHRARLVATGKR